MQTSGEPSVVCILIASLELLSGNDEINVISLELILIGDSPHPPLPIYPNITFHFQITGNIVSYCNR